MTPEWLAAIGSVGTLVVALVLIIKQYGALSATVRLSKKQDEALVATTKALNDEMAWRRNEADRQRQQQARSVRLRLFRGWRPGDDDEPLILAFLKGSGLHPSGLTTRMVVANNSDGPIRDITATSGDAPIRCGIVQGERRMSAPPLNAVTAGGFARLYWLKEVDEQDISVYFTDESGVRWRLHHRDGLSEVPGDK
ncbi:hypothetical protein [Nocardiopsis sp. YSL2]|uniref:hypothetical protein n=1 Tax=Nocardiopsis sp. YSL2 TaxID=2939492 RepID=UPI0026F45A13|nr:hypothetical protein [Nocardiopsis sp. YSL2]